MMIKKICLFLLLALLFFPLMEQCFSFNKRQWKIKDPDGHFPKEEAPIWNVENWIASDFQHQTSAYLKRNMSVRPLFYRFNNQLKYSILKEIRANRVVEGKEGYLYELGYVEAYFKADLKHPKTIEDYAAKLKFIQTELETRYQTKLLVVVAPSKASYYPEYLPDYFEFQNESMSNSSMYKQGFQKKQIPYIDFDSYFVTQKETTAYPLFPKLGTHWSLYGGMMAIDSILHRMGDITGKNIARLDLAKKLVVSTTPRGTDDDIGRGLNLFQKLESDTMAYFENYKKIDSTHYKPKVILLGDSFIYTMWNAWVPHQYFDKSATQFWYYFNDVIAADYSIKGKKTRDIDWLNYLKEADMLVMVYNPNTIKSFGSGFIGAAYKALKEEKK